MDENNVLYRRTMPTTTVSDDSCSFPSFPWFAENFKRRKSRLGTHRKQGRVLPDLSVNSADYPTADEKIAVSPAAPSLSLSKPFEETKNNTPSFATDTVDSPVCNGEMSVSAPPSPLIPCIENARKDSFPFVDVVDTKANEPRVRFAEPPMIEKFTVPQRNSEIPVVDAKANEPRVRFAEPPPMIEKFAVPQRNSKIPSKITVNGRVYNVLNVLGTGGSSVVYEVRLPDSRDSLAVKKVKLSKVDEDIAKGYLNEVQMLESLQNCDVIIKILDHQLLYEDGKRNLYVVMEKGDTDLSGLIRSVNAAQKLSIPMIVYYWSEMLAAVNEVHSRGIIHSDLKPANFLLVKGRLKLIDFGIASSISADVTSVRKETLCGTLNYMSPEALKFDLGSAVYKITFKTDVWSLGCILYNLIYGHLPFQHIKERWNKMNAIVSPNVDVEFPEKKGIPVVLMDSLKACLQKDPKKRPSISELLDRILRIYDANPENKE